MRNDIFMYTGLVKKGTHKIQKKKGLDRIKKKRKQDNLTT